MIRKFAGKTVSVIRSAAPVVRKVAVGAYAVGFCALAQAQTTPSSLADVEAAADEGYGIFTKVRPWVIGVVLLSIGLGYLGMLRRRR